MKMRFIYKVLPVPVFYTDKIVPEGFAGISLGPAVCIRKKYIDDIGLLEHELQHCRQFYKLLILHYVLYKLSPRYKYNAEIECYQIQLKYVDDYQRGVERFAGFITNKYGLNVEQHEVEYDLKYKR